jgi:hypothetical protein
VRELVLNRSPREHACIEQVRVEPDVPGSRARGRAAPDVDPDLLGDQLPAERARVQGRPHLLTLSGRAAVEGIASAFGRCRRGRRHAASVAASSDRRGSGRHSF